jgi:DNA-binding NtrC family response regulator
MMTAHVSVHTAVEAMKLGAYDYLTKPFTTDELLLKLGHFFDHRREAEENVALRRALDTDFTFHSMIGRSPSMRRLFDRILTVADSDAAVLVAGETGTGKELVAEMIHQNSPRRRMPLVKVSCVALRESLIESELFGHEKGAFSGAIRTRPGRFELADGGTIFLDDIDDVPLPVQPKLLRVLQNKEFERVGGDRPLKADVRVIAATKVDLAALAAEAKFREDLLYRLNTVTLRLPPLRERRDEIPPLVEHFVRKYDRRAGRRFSAAALQLLERYRWPGNVRELEHVVEAALVMTREEEIGPQHLPESFTEKAVLEPGAVRGGLKDELADVERDTVSSALERFGGNVSEAARHLGIARSTLRDRMKRLGLAGDTPQPDDPAE